MAFESQSERNPFSEVGTIPNTHSKYSAQIHCFGYAEAELLSEKAITEQECTPSTSAIPTMVRGDIGPTQICKLCLSQSYLINNFMGSTTCWPRMTSKKLKPV